MANREAEEAAVRALQGVLASAAEERTKRFWEGYLKGAIGFRGVGIPRLRELLGPWRAERGIDGWPAARQFELALRLLAEPLAEDKLAGILLLEAIEWRAALPRYAEVFAAGQLADWNSCDWFCVRVLGPTIARGGLAAGSRLAPAR